MSESQVSVIIVTYNSEAVIGDCVRPLSRQDGIELIVLDNASADRTLAVIAEEAPDAVVVRNEENVGFARGVDARHAMHGGERYCCSIPMHASPLETYSLWRPSSTSRQRSGSSHRRSLNRPAASRSARAAGDPTSSACSTTFRAFRDCRTDILVSKVCISSIPTTSQRESWIGYPEHA